MNAHHEHIPIVWLLSSKYFRNVWRTRTAGHSISVSAIVRRVRESVWLNRVVRRLGFP